MLSFFSSTITSRGLKHWLFLFPICNVNFLDSYLKCKLLGTLQKMLTGFKGLKICYTASLENSLSDCCCTEFKTVFTGY